MARRHWIIVTFIVVLLFPLLVDTPNLPIHRVSAENSGSPQYSPPPPYGGEPVGEYSGNGATTSIMATYNKTLSTPTSSDVLTDFSVTLPINWDVVINTSFSSLTANPVVLDVETDDSTVEGSHNIRAAMSFQITNSCYLSSVMVRVEAGLFELLDSLDDLYVSIFNATEDSGRPKPDQLWSTREYFDLGDSTDTFDGWINATWASPVHLTTSTSYNDYYFVVLVPESGATVSWQFRTDVGNGDSGYAWRWMAGWTFYPVDYFLNVSLLPSGGTPKPSQISMQVNGTAVTDAVGNAGWWASSFTASSSPTLFNVTATWPITFDYTYIALFAQILVGTTNFQTDYQLSLASWNITASVSFPNVNADANSRTINFSIPANWKIQTLLNGTTVKSITDYKDNSTNPGSPGYLFIDEPTGAGNGTLWRTVSSDLNYVQTPVIKRGGLDVTGQQVNITDTLAVSVQVSTFTDGQGRFNPYDELGVSLNEWLQTPDGGGLLNFTSFTPSSYAITNVSMRCEVVWSNSFHAGVGLSSVGLLYPTMVTGTPSAYTSLIGDMVNVSVYYEDTHNTAGIPNAEVNVTFSGSTYTLTDRGAGYYWSLLDTGTMGLGRGVHSGSVSADRQGYSASLTSVSLILWSKTQLVANFTSLTISYADSVVLEVNYSVLTPLGEGGILGAQVNISESGIVLSALTDVGGGNYTILLSGMSLDVGVHNLIVNASKPGELYQNNTLFVILTVTGEPTTITGAAPSSVDGGTAFNVSIDYLFLNGTGITGASISCLLNDSPFLGFTLFDLANGTYKAQFVLDVSGSPATFNISLTASRGGFDAASYDALVDVLIRPTTYSVQVLSASPVVYSAPFQIRVTYQDMLAVGIIGAVVDGNWSTVISVDNLDGTYTVTCQTTGWAAGWWTISFNITVINYDTQYFSETFYLVWSTTLTPQGGDFSPADYENENITLEVTFWDSSNSVGITGATVWTVFQSVTHNFVSMGSGVYQLTLNLTGVTPTTYPLIVYAQRPNYENQSIGLNLGVLAKLIPSLTVTLPQGIVEGTEVAVRVDLSFANATPIIGATINLTVWVDYQNGTILVLYSQIVTTDNLGTRIAPVQLVPYSEEEWASGTFEPYLWASAEFAGTRALTGSTDVTSEPISPRFNPWPWWVYLLVTLLPFILILIFIIIISWAYYAKRVKPRRLAQQQALEQSAGVWAQRMMGLMNLRALFVTYSKTGLPIFTYDFAGGEMPSTLLSGFLSAVNAFYSEVSGELDRESQLRDIHYKDLHLSLREGKYIVSVLILGSSPSEVLTQSLAEFTSKFEVHFRKNLATFEGRIDVFDKATEIVESSFHGELLLAYECVKPPSRGFARKIYELGVDLADDEGRIYLPQLFVAAIEKFGSKKKFDIANALEQLHEQGCFVPSNTNTAAPPEKSDNPSDASIFF
ncbi:MAG: hypothetical protein ACFE9D_05360 [Promethearchaeota archaeon]